MTGVTSESWCVCRPKSAQIPFMTPPSEENDIKAPQGILKVQVSLVVCTREWLILH